jgi:hypothetical protein
MNEPSRSGLRPADFARFLVTTASWALGALLAGAVFLVPRMRILPRLGCAAAVVFFVGAILAAARAMKILMDVELGIAKVQPEKLSKYFQSALSWLVMGLALLGAAAFSAIVEPVRP